MKIASFLVACVAIMSVGVVASMAGAPDFPSHAVPAFGDLITAMSLAIPASTTGRGIVAVRADASSDPKALVEQIKSAFEQFKAANDERIAKLETGKADALLDEKVEKINGHISDLQSKLVDLASKTAAAGLNAPGEQDLAKAAAQFSIENGREVSVDEYRSYRDSFAMALRKGKGAGSEVMAHMSVNSDPDGGYTVTPDMSGRIVKKVYETTPMRQVASVVTIGTDALEGFNDHDEADSGWVGEKQPRPDTDTPKIGKWSIPVHEIYAQPKVTQKLIDDSAWNIEQWLADKVSDRFARVENAAFVTGNGALKPRGLWTYPTAATADATRPWGTFEHINTGASGAFAAAPGGSDILIDLVFALKAAYRNGANWMMSRATLAAVRKLKDGDGNYLWQPNFEARQGGLVLGFPVVEGEDVPAIGSNALAIAFGNFAEAYTIVDRIGIRVLRDPFTDKPNIRFYTTKRVGGGAINFEAVKFLRFSNS